VGCQLNLQKDFKSLVLRNGNMIDKKEVLGEPQISKNRGDYEWDRIMRHSCGHTNDEDRLGPSLPTRKPSTLLLSTMDSNNYEIPDFDLNGFLWYQVCFICPFQFHE
jgi:hypothetical protein